MFSEFQYQMNKGTMLELQAFDIYRASFQQFLTKSKTVSSAASELFYEYSVAAILFWNVRKLIISYVYFGMSKL